MIRRWRAGSGGERAWLVGRVSIVGDRGLRNGYDRDSPAPARRRDDRRRGPCCVESALIVALYLGYVSARLLANGDVDQARRHADETCHLEGWLHLDVEAATNVFVSSTVWLAAPVSYWYAALHYLVTPAVLVWLFLRHRSCYGRARTALVLTSAIGLVGFLLYPTAPPRFVAGYVDTLAAVRRHRLVVGARLGAARLRPVHERARRDAVAALRLGAVGGLGGGPRRRPAALALPGHRVRRGHGRGGRRDRQPLDPGRRRRLGGRRRPASR